MRFEPDDAYEPRRDRRNEYLDDLDEDEYYEDDCDYGEGALDPRLSDRILADAEAEVGQLALEMELELDEDRASAFGAEYEPASERSSREDEILREDDSPAAERPGWRRRVLSSDNVWRAPAPGRAHRYRSSDEMIKKRHVVRFE